MCLGYSKKYGQFNENILDFGFMLDGVGVRLGIIEDLRALGAGTCAEPWEQVGADEGH